MKYKLWLSKYGTPLLYIILFTGICLATCSCNVYKKTTRTEIDTTYVNRIIDTTVKSQKFRIYKGTIYLDTLKIENKFCKVTIYPSNGEIKTELVSKPFEVKLHAVKTEKIIDREKTRKPFDRFINRIGLYFCFFLAGYIVRSFQHEKPKNL